MLTYYPSTGELVFNGFYSFELEAGESCKGLSSEEIDALEDYITYSYLPTDEIENFVKLYKYDYSVMLKEVLLSTKARMKQGCSSPLEFRFDVQSKVPQGFITHFEKSLLRYFKKYPVNAYGVDRVIVIHP